MYTQLKNRRTFAPKGDASAAVSGGPGIGPGAESDELAGDESAFDPGAMCAHHAKMADFHASKAGPVEGSAEEEAGELPDLEAMEDEGAEVLTPPEAFGKPQTAEKPEGAAEPPKKKGPSAFNKFRTGGY